MTLTTTTGPDGTYLVTNLPPGRYTATLAPSAVPSGWTSPTVTVMLLAGEVNLSGDLALQAVDGAGSSRPTPGNRPGIIAFTGAGSMTLLAVGMGLVVVGGSLRATSRRRNRA